MQNAQHAAAAAAAQAQAGKQQAAQQQAAQQQAAQGPNAQQEQAAQLAQQYAQQAAAAAAALYAPRHIPHNTNQIAKPAIETFSGEPEDDIDSWLQGFEHLARMSSWNDQEAVDFAERAMRGKARMHFRRLTEKGIPSFDHLKASLKARFGESPLAIISRLEQRKHQKGESVREYIADMRNLFDKANYPPATQTLKFCTNLNAAFRARVIGRTPADMDEAEAVALYFDDTDVGQDPDRANALANKREDKSGQDSLKSFGKEMSKGLGDLAHGITESMSRLTLSLTKNGSGLPVGVGQAQGNRSYNPITCFNCGEKGHPQSKCPRPRQRPAKQNYAGQVNAYQPQYAPQPYPLPPPRYHCPPQPYPYGAQEQAYTPLVYPAIRHQGAAGPQGYRSNNLMSRVEQPTTNLRTAVTENEKMVYPEAEIYAGAATRGPRAHVPFSPKAVNSRRATEPVRRTNTNPNSGSRQPEMPTIPAARGRGTFDILAQMQTLLVKNDVLTYLQHAPEAREQLMKRMEEMGPPSSRSPARAPASAIRPAARVPFPTFPAARPPSANPPAPQQGAVPMEHMMDTEEAYLTEMPRSLNTVVKAQVLIGGQPFEGILDTGASDSAISMDVVRRLGLLDRMTPSDLTFLTAGGTSERPEGLLLALPIRIGRLELKIDTMVTPAQNYNILVGNDWLRMAGADLLLSKSTLRIRLGAEQWEDVPIDAEMIQRRLNTFLR